MLGWVFLLVGVLFEVAAFVFMRMNAGQTSNYVAMVGVGVCFLLSLLFLGFAAKYMSVAIVYVVSAGLGTALIMLTTVVFFGEKMSMTSLFSVGFILLGVIGLNMNGTH